MVRAILATLLAMKRSVIAFVLIVILGLLSMGFLGALLYYPVYPLFAARYGDLNDWRGDWVWPAIIMVGMLWSIGFLIAGFVNHRLVSVNARVALRRAVYALVLWAWAAILWAVTLANAYRAPL